jgi:photosystem II stability/assembly factor-like uncharacterized protein
MATTNDRILIGTRKGLFDVRRTGGTWQLAAPRLAGQVIPYAVRDPRDGTIWASIDHGHWGVKLSRSRDEGATFEAVDPPKYPEATGATAKYYWVIQPGPAARPGTIWIGTEPGGLFQSDDGGTSWRLNQPLWDLRKEHAWQGGGRGDAAIHSICWDPTDPDHVYVAISCAGVLETKDGGASWAYVNKGMINVFDPGSNADFGHDPHCVALAPSEPSVLWQANHCGVFRTTNGAATWDNLTQKPLVDFGFPVAVHPTNADVAWLVPMQSDEQRTTVEGRLMVVRTDDGGTTWQAHREGLPAPSYDFPYRHGLDVSADGETLAFATTSGNLYVSGNGGRRWTTVSSSLPPAYSLRFA